MSQDMFNLTPPSGKPLFTAPNAAETVRPVTQAPQQPPRPPHHLPTAMPEIEEASGSRRMLASAAMVVAVAGLGFLGWYAFNESSAQTASSEELPVITASSEPYKEAPENPGGMVIPDQERKIFNRLDGEGATAEDTVEEGMASLTPEQADPASPEVIQQAVAEEPADAALEEDPADIAPAAGEATQATVVADINEDAGEAYAAESAAVEELAEEKLAEESHVPAEPIEAAPAEAEAEPVKAVETEHVKLASVEPLNTVSKAAPKKEINVIRMKDGEAVAKRVPISMRNDRFQPGSEKVPASGDYKVQLGSYKSEDSLKLAWASLQKKFPGELGDLNHEIQRADLGEKGIFFRLIASGVESESGAKSVCSALKARDQGCIVVH